MGCTKSSELDYITCKYDHEIKLREFEENDLGFFRTPFTSVVTPITNEREISKEKYHNFLVKHFSENAVKVGMNDYFKIEKNGDFVYDANKIKKFVYLVEPDSLMKIGNKNIHDKIGFIYALIKTNYDENLSTPIYRLDRDFNDMMNDFVDISCGVLVDEYIKKNGPSEEMLKLRTVKEEIKKKYIDLLFTVGGKEAEAINYQELENKFSENPFLFTTGDIRLCAWNIIYKK